jgi:Tir chaperone protein (CesT) family
MPLVIAPRGVNPARSTMDVPTLQGWLDKLGYETALEGPSTLRVRPREGAPVPPFFLQADPNWVMLSMLPMLPPGAFRPEGLGRRLLAQNREMRVAKYALDENGAIVLCAELPTESLDFGELADAVERTVHYARRFEQDVLLGA